ncbi:MAG: hypothetical protein IJ257_05085 [Treponema sp.]|nr:hypothetical protein [Treponema sp.]
MKNKISSTIFKLLSILFLPLLFSCSNLTDDSSALKSKNGLATIKVDVENTDARTILPAIEITDLALTGKYESGSEESLATAQTLDEMSSKEIEIQTGNWEFTLAAKVSGTAYTATITKDIESQGENSLNFTLEPASGTTKGSLDFSMTFTGNDSEQYTIKVSLASFSPTYEKNAGEKLEFYLSPLEEGSYPLKIDFYAKDTSEILNTYQSIVRIKKGVTTRAEVTNFNLNDIYSISYENFETESGDTLDPETSVMTLKFSRKSGDSDGYIALPKLTNSELTFSGWYTKNPAASDFEESSKVEEFGTAPDTVQKIKVTENQNLKDLTLYAKWLMNTSGTIHTALDYEFNFAIDSPFLALPAQKDYGLTFTPKQIEADNTKTQIYYNPADKELYKDSAFTKPCASGEKITFSAPLYCESKKVTDCTISISTTGEFLVTVPALIYDEVYTLKISALYLGLLYDAEFKLAVSKTEIDAAELTTANYSSFTEISITNTAGMNILSTISESKDFSGKKIILENDVELDSSFVAISTFKGTFDGNDKTISGLNGQVALFQTVSGGTVKNLTIEGTSTKAGIVSNLQGGLIEGCTSRVSVTGTEIYVGGIAGIMNGTNTTIRNCANEGTITSSKGYLGGIAGRESSARSIIDSCVNKGTITYTGSSYGLMGGICGSAFGIIRNCINAGEVNGGGTSEVGGIAGCTHCPGNYGFGVINCANLNSVTGSKNIGGLAGIGDGSDYDVNIINCYNAGAITASSSSNGAILGSVTASGTCIFTHNYYKPETASVGVYEKTDSESDSTSSIPSEAEMNTWVNSNNSSGIYKTWTIKDGNPVPDVGYNW